ncbi:hypothetical protein ACFQQB_43185 [Nonomuraea rubra]|uniref:hypothetical protein n=1 Tax=Nonomuraea rubra TaxID=46180 RepID=UPI003607BAFF
MAPTSRKLRTPATVPKNGCVTYDAIEWTATIRARIAGPSPNRACKVGSGAPSIAVMASLATWTAARKAASLVPPGTPGLRMMCGV